jgi:hypothetical protein
MEEHKVEYYPNGSKYYETWYKDGKLHREDGPSYISYNLDGNKRYVEWYKDDKFHREDGPAQIRYYIDGTKSYEYWNLCGGEYTEFEHKELVKLGKTIITRDAAIMNIKHPSEYIHMRCQEVLNGRA